MKFISSFAVSAVLAILTVGIASIASAQATSRPAAASPEQRFECMSISGGGRMFSPASSPLDPKRLYVSCDMGTFYVSHDDGKSWYMCDMEEMQGACACKPAFHPTDVNVVYMPYERANVMQIRVSRDGGKHWQVLCEKVPWKIMSGHAKGDRYWSTNELMLDPSNPDIFYASTCEGLFRSTDGGKNFTKCNGVDGKTIGVCIPPVSSKAPCVAGTADGVYVSYDRGKTWTKQGGKGLPDALQGFCAAPDAASGQTFIYMSGKTGGIYYSHDSGATFTSGKELPENSFMFLSMSQTNAKIAYASDWNPKGKWGIWKTTDGGATWASVYDTGAKGNVRWGWVYYELGVGWGGFANGFSVNSANPDIAVYSNAMEFFITRDGGKTWQEEASGFAGTGEPRRGQPWAGRGLETALPIDCTFDPFDKNRMYLCYGDILFLASADNGKTWRRSATGIPKEWQNAMWDLVPDPARKGELYAAVASAHGVAGWGDTDPAFNKYGGGVVMSTDSGETWKVVSEGLPVKKSACVSLAMDPTSPPESRTLYCVYYYDGVYKSIDSGKTWQRKSNGLARGENTNAMKVRVGPDGTVYCLLTGLRKDSRFSPGGLFKSTDGAETWTEVTKGTNIYWPVRFAVDPKNSDRMYVTANSAPGNGTDGLWTTIDGGKTWRNEVTTAQVGKELFPYIHSGEVTFHPTVKGLIYYATKTHGLWFSSDDGKTWQRMTGIAPLSAGRIAFDPKDPMIMYVTSKGLWKGPAMGFSKSRKAQ